MRKKTLDDDMGSSLFSGVERLIVNTGKAVLLTVAVGVLGFTSCSKKNNNISNINQTYSIENSQEIPGVEYTLSGLMEVYQNQLGREVSPEKVIAKNLPFYNEETGTYSRYLNNLK